MSKRGSNSELFAHENDALPLGRTYVDIAMVFEMLLYIIV